MSASEQTCIRRNHYFSGASRHKSLVQPLLPTSAKWIGISRPLERTFQAYEQLNNQSVVVFVSGDPLLFGFGNTLLKRFPDSQIRFFPSVSSVQHLCHAARLPYNELVVVSLHGRCPDSLYRELLRQTPRIAVLTDEKYTLQWLAQTLLNYGYDNYTLWVGENLGSETEKIRHYSLKEVAETRFSTLNIGLLIQKHKRFIPFGIPDEELMKLKGRPHMITKMPIRLNTLHALQLSNKHVFWDIGFCTGAVSIEARLRHPELHVIAFEKRPSCQTLWDINTKRWGALGMQALLKDFVRMNEQVLDKLPKPKAVFVGGHGNELDKMLERLNKYLLPKGQVVMNAFRSKELFLNVCQHLGWQTKELCTLQVDDHNPIHILQAQKP